MIFKLTHYRLLSRHSWVPFRTNGVDDILSFGIPLHRIVQ
jgi:hypothetical protein